MTLYATLVCDNVDHDLVLHDVGPSPMEVAKAFRSMSGLGLWWAKQAVTAAPPVRLLEEIDERDARRFAGILCAAGAWATAEPVVLAGRG
ncbi:ribosomal protein L7/L12 [Kitasatospora sp. NPDC094015]|uniref:ribosomal protein L7/L12 n=1 Tax=Kitasatospora sp. NPDC094015 TaxID=3155205 RepID=UPI0033166964